MLKITIHDSAKECRFRLEGRLAGEWVRELELCWQTASSTTSGRHTTVDLTDVDFVDSAGQNLLERMHSGGVHFRAVSPIMKDLVCQIAGDPEPVAAGPRPKRAGGTGRLASRVCLAGVLAVCVSQMYGADPAAAVDALDRYVAQAAPGPQADTAVQLEIHAALPKMGRSGVLQALEFIPRRGRALFRVLTFQGDSTVKQQVIARYLSAEAEAHQTAADAISLNRSNYRFQYHGSADYLGRQAWIFRVEPKHKRAGMFSGELWLDAETAQPLRQWGRLVKNPSVFVKSVSFVRDYDLTTAAPRRLIVNLDTRIAGTAEMTVWYRPVASGPQALVAFRCDRFEETPVSKMSPAAGSPDANIRSDSGPNPCAL